jgi:hypothetical protein
MKMIEVLIYQSHFLPYEILIPSTFKEETELLDDVNMLKLKCHYSTCYCQMRKMFLEYLEYSISQDSVIGSTIKNRYK